MAPSVVPLIGIPIKPFGIAKLRLETELDATQRSQLGKRIAAHTIATARSVAPVVVISADAGVRVFATAHGADSIAEKEPGLDAAAASLQSHAQRLGRPWLVLHADLPMLTPADVAALVLALRDRGGVIAPSHDGGTTALGAVRPVATRYGPGSYHRHLPRLDSPAVVTRPNLAFDLDTTRDLARIRRLLPDLVDDDR